MVSEGQASFCLTAAVVSALIAKKGHIPFRNSKLTFFLQDSLGTGLVGSQHLTQRAGGDSKALMFVQVSPAEDNAQETACSLTFASRVRNVELGPAKKKQESGAKEFEKEIEQ